MATRNTAKYGSELARLLNALAASPDNIVSTQDTLTDILEKVSLFPSNRVRNFRGRVSYFNQSEARKYPVLASDWLKYETLPFPENFVRYKIIELSSDIVPGLTHSAPFEKFAQHFKR